MPKRHSRLARLVAFVIAAVMLVFVVMAAGGSLFGLPLTPENTRPLPPPLPIQGAIH